ncbi:PadR family transcriptional regulator [Nonomuraea sp. NEAU-L178]|nr:PadR family transcriptional regulator [Nonomuraea aurantiaca]
MRARWPALGRGRSRGGRGRCAGRCRRRPGGGRGPGGVRTGTAAGEQLIETDHEEVVDGRARRYYRLTAEGAARLLVEAERLRRNADTAAARLRSAATASN